MSQDTTLIEQLVNEVRRLLPEAALCLDSRQIMSGDIFVASPGHVGDGRQHIADAVKRGAMGVIYQEPLNEDQRSALASVASWGVVDLRHQLGVLASRWWHDPSSSLKIVAVTGTNGKTSVSSWLAAALRQLGMPCAVIGTLGVTDAHGALVPGFLTTPDVISVHRYLAQLRDGGATHVVMEASSIGLDQDRLSNVTIDVGVFTNLTQDHLDYHADMSSYASAKALLFKRHEMQCAVLNDDDPYSAKLRDLTDAEVVTFGMQRLDADVRAQNLSNQEGGQQFDLIIDGQCSVIQTPFAGRHNVSNLLAVAAVLRFFGAETRSIGRALQALPPVPGRLEPVASIRKHDAGPMVLVDYAHTPDALSNVLQALLPISRVRGGKLWVLIGCGGNRDASKRPLMAREAQQWADHVVLTSDNPRDEDPETILAQMKQGLVGAGVDLVEVDRGAAILTAVWRAAKEDVVVLAGKGHERWQEIKGQRQQFDDRQWASLALTLWDEPLPVQTDTRQLHPGSLFVALSGERFDGHDYLSDARDAGAIAAVVAKDIKLEGLPQFVLGDTKAALQTIARAWRKRFDLPVIGITGSNGKTTTKEMTAAICRAWVGDQQTLATVGNLNNEIGVPLTLLGLRSHHRVAVIEMGMNHPGEIATLSKIAQPTVALVLNAQREHQEFMQSVQAVAIENGQALIGLSDHGVAVYPANDPFTPLWSSMAAHARRRLTFGVGTPEGLSISEPHVSVSGSEFDLSVDGQFEHVYLPVSGRHNVFNAAAAVACSIAAGATLKLACQALRFFKAVKGRLQMHRLTGGQTLIDDTYNANPDSVRAAVDVLVSLPAPRALILGDMGEVGEQGPQMHQEVGAYAREKGVDFLWALGLATKDSVSAFGKNAIWFETPESLCAHVSKELPASMLVKGSRFMAMERIVKHWLNNAASVSGCSEVNHAG